MRAPWTDGAAREIGVLWLEEQIAVSADFGRRARQAETAFAPGEEAAAQRSIARVFTVANEVPAETLAALHAAIAACPDPAAALARAGSAGVLSDAELFDLSRFLDALATVRELASHATLRDVGVPEWPARVAEALALGRTPDRTFYLADDFDAGLAAARGDAATARAQYDAERSRLTARVAAYAGLDHIRDGEFVLMRDRAPAPLPPELRVLREAPTYYLCEVTLDQAALDALAALDKAETRVAEYEETVRARLSREVGAAAAALEAAAATLGRLDAFVARARFAQRYACCLPQIATDASLDFSDARFLPLAASLEERGHRYVPLSLALEGVCVLTGPNMGGKSAALRTCGFVAACVALGLPVPASAARVALFDELAWVGSGGEPEGMSLLSSFGREVVQLRDFLGRDARRPLVLVDEFARTTSPREGRALLIALLERLHEVDALAFAATHLSRIAEDAGVSHFAVAGLRELPQRSEGSLDLDAAIERIAQVMDYRIHRVSGDAGLRADAVALADVLGLDPALIVRARENL